MKSESSDFPLLPCPSISGREWNGKYMVRTKPKKCIGKELKMSKEFKFSRQELKAIYHDVVSGVIAEIAEHVPNFTDTDTGRFDDVGGLRTLEMTLVDNNIEDDGNGSDVVGTLTVQFFDNWIETDETTDVVTAWLDVREEDSQ